MYQWESPTDESFRLLAFILSDRGHGNAACQMMTASPFAFHDVDLVDSTCGTKLGPSGHTRLMSAVRAGDMRRLHELVYYPLLGRLSDGKPRNNLQTALGITDIAGFSALHHAVDCVQPDVIPLLIEAGADPLARPVSKGLGAMSPLELAAEVSQNSARGPALFCVMLETTEARCATLADGAAILVEAVRSALNIACRNVQRFATDPVALARRRECATSAASKLVQLGGQNAACIDLAASSFSDLLVFFLNAGVLPFAPGRAPHGAHWHHFNALNFPGEGHVPQRAPQSACATRLLAQRYAMGALNVFLPRVLELIAAGATDEAGVPFTRAGLDVDIRLAIEAACTKNWRLDVPSYAGRAYEVVSLLLQHLDDVDQLFPPPADPWSLTCNGALLRAAFWNPSIVELLLGKLRGTPLLRRLLLDGIGDGATFGEPPLAVAVATPGQERSVRAIIDCIFAEDSPSTEDERTQILTRSKMSQLFNPAYWQ